MLKESSREYRAEHRELTQKVIGVFFEVYNELGHGFLKSVYQKPSNMLSSPKAYGFLERLKCPFGFEARRSVNLRQTFWSKNVSCWS
jgi:PD-(D/E)XK nuclease superfamily